MKKSIQDILLLAMKRSDVRQELASHDEMAKVLAFLAYNVGDLNDFDAGDIINARVLLRGGALGRGAYGTANGTLAEVLATSHTSSSPARSLPAGSGPALAVGAGLLLMVAAVAGAVVFARRS